MTYKSGIYQHVTGAQQGGHAVEIVGYGVENGVLFWKIKNSWGPKWGEQGYFRMLKGVNECGIEELVISTEV
jgi:cathepsin B